MKINQPNRKIIIAAFAAGAVALLTIAVMMPGTGDAGDGIMHHLISRYSWKYPHLFLDHWGKPVFTLLSSPFSQFGITGIKIFNVLVAIFTCLMLYDTGVKAKLRFAWVLPVFLLCMPEYLIQIFSGLTEPLFAGFIVLAIWLRSRDKHLASVLVISFLPFVRSEGVFILPVWGLLLLIEQKYKLIPWLFCGNVVYGLAGLLVYDSPFWYFTQNPYDVEATNYGHGDWMHFPEKLIFVAGIPLAILTPIGLLRIFPGILGNKTQYTGNLVAERAYLIPATFLAFFVGHMVMWRYGLFHSMGLQRVLVGVLPMAAWLCVEALGFVTDFIRWKNVRIADGLAWATVLFIVIFPYTPNKSGYNLPWPFLLTPDQESNRDAAAWMQQNPKAENAIYFAGHPDQAIAFEFDPFDPAQRKYLSGLPKGEGNPGDIVIWDDWFAPVEYGMPKSWLDNQPERFQFLKCFEHEQRGRKRSICLYKIIKASNHE